MGARLTFLGIVAFWVTMNGLLWQVEYGARGGDTPVPAPLVWRKILTAPDASSLSVYQKGDRVGYCEISTGVGQQMATFDEGKPPPEGFVAQPGYLLHVAGNVSLGDFTNRLKFDGRFRFDRSRRWQEFNLKITSRQAVVEMASLATNQAVHVKVSSEGVALWERELAFTDLRDPRALVPLLAGNVAGDFLGALEATGMLPESTPDIEWEARRTRVQLGGESVPIYRLETSILGRTLHVEVSTLGEIMRIELPGGFSARIDEWSKS